MLFQHFHQFLKLVAGIFIHEIVIGQLFYLPAQVRGQPIQPGKVLFSPILDVFQQPLLHFRAEFATGLGLFSGFIQLILDTLTFSLEYLVQFPAYFVQH